MSDKTKKLNFDAKDPKELKTLFERCYDISEDYRTDYEYDWEDAFKLYYGFLDLTGRDPNLLHAIIPKAFANIETLTATDVKSLFGAKPYFPLTPKEPVFRSATEQLQALIDYFMDIHDFFGTGANNSKLTRLLGTSVIELFWRYEIRERPVQTQKKVKGYVIDAGKKTEKYIYEGLDFRLIPPWMLGVDPYTSKFETMRWNYVKQPMSYDELKGMMEFGNYLVDFEDIQKGGECDLGALSNRLKSDIGYMADIQDADIGSLYRFWIPTRGRYLEFWGHKEMGMFLIRDIANVYAFDPKVRFINTQDPYPDRFYGIGEIRPSAQLFMMLNDSYSQLFNTQQQTMNPPMMFPQGKLNPNKFTNSPGIWTPYDSSLMTDIKNAIFPLPLKPLDQHSYQMPEIIDKKIDEVTGLPSISKGEFPDRQERAYTVRKVTEGADNRIAMKLVFSEKAMMEMALKGWEIIRKNIGDEQKQAILGDNARLLLFDHPDEIPYGYEMNFNGSDLIKDKDAKQQVRISLYQMSTPDVSNKREEYKILMENSNVYKQEEIDRISNVQQPQQPQAAGQSVEGQRTVGQNAPQPNELAPQALQQITGTAASTAA
jgi:hypothetical protein